MSPNRIAMIMGSFNKGGVEAVIYNYYKFIDKEKFQFDFICFDDSKFIPENEILSMGGKVYIVPNIKHIFKYIKAVRRIFKDNNYEVVHSNISSLNAIPLYCAKKEGVKVRISHAHSTSNKNEMFRNFVKNILKKLQFNNATAYFYCSKLSGNWLFGKKKMNSKNAFFIPNAIDSTKFCKNNTINEEMRKKYDISNDSIVCGQIGRLVKQKNVLFTIDLFEKFHRENNNSYLFLVGDGPMKQKIDNKVKECGLSKHVIFVSNTDNPECFYNLFNCFLLPSLYEGLPVVAIESQFENLPIICSKKITDEVKLTDYVIFEEKEFNINEWISLINDATTKHELLNNDNYLDAYEIRNATKKLEQIYSHFIEVNLC